MIPVTIIVHPKEKLSKCSLRNLRDRPGFDFLKATKKFQFDATNYILLSTDAPELTITDNAYPILLLDSTWRLLPKLEACLTGNPIRRSIPQNIKTAYPRQSKISEDPQNGLASIEALYIALKILGHDDSSILDNYHWKEEFLLKLRNPKNNS